MSPQPLACPGSSGVIVLDTLPADPRMADQARQTLFRSRAHATMVTELADQRSSSTGFGRSSSEPIVKLTSARSPVVVVITARHAPGGSVQPT